MGLRNVRMRYIAWAVMDDGYVDFRGGGGVSIARERIGGVVELKVVRPTSWEGQ